MAHRNPTASALGEPLDCYAAALGHCAGTVAGCAVYLVVICVALLSHYLGETFTVFPLLLAALLKASAPRQAGRAPTSSQGVEGRVDAQSTSG